MALPQKNRIGEILVKAKVIDELQLRSALAHVEQWGGRLTSAVLDMNLADEDAATDALSNALGMQRIRLGNIPKDAAALARIDVDWAEKNAVFPMALKDNGKTLYVALADPTNVTVLDELNRRARARVVPYIAGEIEIAHAIMRNYRGIEPPPADKIRRPAGKRSPDAFSEGEDEFKITDMNGKTLMKRLADIDPNLAKAAEAGKPAPPTGVAVPGGAADLLDDLLGGSSAGAPAAAVLSEADWQRVETVRKNQEKSAVILRAMMELLAEKGYRR